MATIADLNAHSHPPDQEWHLRTMGTLVDYKGGLVKVEVACSIPTCPFWVTLNGADAAAWVKMAKEGANGC